MKVLVTGSAGHLGHALMHSLRERGHESLGIDIVASATTDRVGSITDRDFVRDAMQGVEAVLHAATLHKPHVATHPRQAFIDTNVTGTLHLLEEAVAAGVGAFVFTSTTSTFGRALTAAPGQPAAWITEEVVPLPKNIYGITKLAAENLCELFHRKFELPCLILRTSRFFPERDDDEARRSAFDDANLKVNELLYRRADIADIVSAHLCALDAAPRAGFDRLIVSATTPFAREDAPALGQHAPDIVARYVPDYAEEYRRRGWQMLETLDRVYVNERARKVLDWRPQFDFASAVARLRMNQDYRSALTHVVGVKGYHADEFSEGPYPVDA